MRFIATAAILALLSPLQINAEADAAVPAPETLPALMPTVTNLQEQLDYDENGKLSYFYLVYPKRENDECDAPNYTEGPKSYYKKAPLEGDALKEVFPDYDPEGENGGNCPAAWLEVGTDRAVAGHTLPDLHYTKNDKQTFQNWFWENANLKEVCFMNYYSKINPIKVYWVKPGGEESLNMELSYAERNTKCFNSYLGHQFRAYAKKDGAPDDEEYTLLEEVTIDHILVKAFGVSPPHKSFGKTTKDFASGIENTLRSEWTRHTVPKRTFSPLGFAKGRLPKDVFASMGAFFYNNRHNKVREEWDGKGFFVNWWETDVFFIQIPWKLKEVYQIRLRDLVSEWAGTPVEQTVMYGLRQYESGARLLTHVDRLRTHAVSLIVNVAQGNLTQDWPVEVFDHNGRLHEVVMEPGDIVYYESAKNLHSRNRALSGANGYYVNMFTHYRPADDGEEWYLKESQNDPVLDVEGDCISEDKENGFGKVKCDDPRLGKFVSPTLFRAQSGQDLIKWWRDTTPGGYVEDEGRVVDEEQDRREYESLLHDDVPIPEGDDDDDDFGDDDDDMDFEQIDDDDDYYPGQESEGDEEDHHDVDVKDEL